MFDVQVLRATVASRCFSDDCDAVLCILSGHPLGGWHLASLRWGTFLRTETALRDLGGAAGWRLMAIAHPQPFKMTFA